MNFDQAFTRLLEHEGGFSDHKSDPGGATNHGVTQAVARANGYQGHMRDLPIEFAKKIAKDGYWTPCRCDDLPVDVRFSVFDGAYNSGVSQSVRWLQRAVGAEADGVIGPKTLALCASRQGVAARYNGHRLMFMAGLKTWPVFGAGWARRVASNLIGA